MKSKLEELASVYEQPEEVMNYYLSDEKRLAEVEQLVLEDNVITFVQEKAKVTEIEASFDEVMNPKTGLRGNNYEGRIDRSCLEPLILSDYLPTRY